VKVWLRLVLVAMLCVGLALACVADVDGNPLTQDFPTVVLSVPVNDEANDGEDVVDDVDRDHMGVRTAQVLMLYSARRRWATIVRRWHRSFLTDTPV
jgi:hypothetical protein